MDLLSLYGLTKDLSKFLELLFSPHDKRSFVDIELLFSLIGRIGSYLRSYSFYRKFAVVVFGG